MDDLTAPRSESGSDTTIVLFVGLYLLLLAFFILLNSISTYEEKRVSAVIGSLNDTFQSWLPDGTGLIRKLRRSELTDVLAAKAFQEEVADLFQTLMPVSEVKVSRPGEFMHVTLPVDSLFASESAEIRRERMTVLESIAEALGQHPPDQRYEVEFVVGSTPLPADAGPEPPSLAIARSATLARTLLDLGAPVGAVAAGLRVGGAELISVSFLTRDVSEADNAFSGPEGD